MGAQPERRKILNEVADTFAQAWLTGDWDSYFAHYADDFVFQYPVPPLVGRWTGDDAIKRRNQWRETFKDVRLNKTGEDIRLFDDPWVVVCNHSESTVNGEVRKNILTTVMHRVNDEGRVVEYREFLGGLSVRPS